MKSEKNRKSKSAVTHKEQDGWLSNRLVASREMDKPLLGQDFLTCLLSELEHYSERRINKSVCRREECSQFSQRCFAWFFDRPAYFYTNAPLQIVSGEEESIAYSYRETRFQNQQVLAVPLRTKPQHSPRHSCEKTHLSGSTTSILPLGWRAVAIATPEIMPMPSETPCWNQCEHWECVDMSLEAT